MATVGTFYDHKPLKKTKTKPLLKNLFKYLSFLPLEKRQRRTSDMARKFQKDESHCPLGWLKMAKCLVEIEIKNNLGWTEQIRENEQTLIRGQRVERFLDERKAFAFKKRRLYLSFRLL